MKFIYILVALSGYAITLSTSGFVLRYFLSKVVRCKPGEECLEAEGTSVSRFGALIGKCENFLTITFILAGAYTALALVFTAKSIVRIDAIKKNPEYYLGGTLINFSYSVFMGFLILLILRLTGCPLQFPVKP